MKTCLACGAKISRRKYCSRKCSAQHRVRNACLIDKDTLIKEYVGDRLELLEISRRHGVSIVTVFNYLKRYGIKTRGGHLDFTRKKIGQLWVIEPLALGHKGGGKHVKWRCRCDCGNEVITYSNHLSRVVHPKCRQCSDKARRSQLELKNYIWYSICRGASGRGLELSIDRDWAYNLFLRQNRTCALSGAEIKFASCAAEHKAGGTTASLDRIDSAKGYARDNVQWVHKTINLMKLRHSNDEFFDWCRKVVNHRDTTQVA